MVSSETTSGRKVLCLVGGLPFSGKTTFARYLSGLRHYPHLEQDALYPQFIEAVKTSPAVRQLYQYRGRVPEEQLAGRMTARIRVVRRSRSEYAP